MKHDYDIALDASSRRAQAAWRQLKSGKTWEAWLAIGQAFVDGRAWAMKHTGANAPWGKAYNQAFSQWMTDYKLDGLHSSERAKLFEVMENLPAITKWRAELTTTERTRLNHPLAVMRRFKSQDAATAIEKKKKPGLRDSVASLSDENNVLKKRLADAEAHNAELQASREAGGMVDKWEALRVLVELSKRGGNGGARLDNNQEPVPDYPPKEIDRLIAGLEELKKTIRYCRKENPRFLMPV